MTRSVVEREVLGVGRAEVDVQSGNRRLLAGPREHGVGEVHAHGTVSEPGQQQREESGAAADVQRVHRIRPRPLAHATGPGRPLLVAEQAVGCALVEGRGPALPVPPEPLLGR